MLIGERSGRGKGKGGILSTWDGAGNRICKDAQSYEPTCMYVRAVNKPMEHIVLAICRRHISLWSKGRLDTANFTKMESFEIREDFIGTYSHCAA